VKVAKLLASTAIDRDYPNPDIKMRIEKNIL